MAAVASTRPISAESGTVVCSEAVALGYVAKLRLEWYGLNPVVVAKSVNVATARILKHGPDPQSLVKQILRRRFSKGQPR